MKPLKVLSIFGTRPEAIKMAPIVRELERRPNIISEVCVTAQHREMLDQVLEIFGITPNYDLDLMRPGQTPTQVAARVLLELDTLLRQVQPDWILVQGDTTTVMAATIAARYLRIKVGHVEAGLRTGDMLNPFPEEMNRKVAGSICNLHFAPTPQSKANLLKENIADDSIVVTGNSVIDALLDISQRDWSPEPDSPLFQWRDLNKDTIGKKLILITAHRRENFGQPLLDICAALKAIASRGADDLHLIYPVHLNPNVQEPVYRLLGDVPNITLIPPVDYLTLVHLMKRSTLILTDSGGIQEEAPSLGVPVLVLRTVTERPEGVAAGTVRVVGTDTESIVSQAFELLTDPAAYQAMSKAVNPYGDGHAAERIVDKLVQVG